MLAGLVLLVASSNVLGDTLRLLVARSANETGLISQLANAFEQGHPGQQVQIVNVGSLETISQARAGKGDAVLSHAPASEELFMADGYGLSRTLIMYNSFAIFGPQQDPLRLRQQTDVLDALRTIATNEVAFVVPGERSGTRERLHQLWHAAGITPDWIGYESSGGGSRATLAAAAEFQTHAFADLGSYFSLSPDKQAQLLPLVRDHRALRNEYHYLVVNPTKVPGANEALAKAFLAFLVSPQGQHTIADFGRGKVSATLYTPAAHLDQELQTRQAQARLAEHQTRIYAFAAGTAVAALTALVLGALYLGLRKRFARQARQVQCLDQAARASHTGLFHWDLSTDRLECSERTRTLLGQTNIAATNLHALLRTVLDARQAHRVSGLLQRYLSSVEDGGFVVDFPLRGQWLELRGQAEWDEDGKPLHMSGALRALARPPEEDGITLADLHDPLTGLPTRQLLSDRLTHTLHQCARDSHACGVLVVGLHSVSQIGELGDSAPDDTIVKAVANRLRQLLRASDTIARMDDDNFAVLLPASSERHCQQAVDKLLAGLQRPFHLDNRSLRVESSIGCAIYPRHGQHNHTLLQRAQLAMLQASRDGQAIAMYRPADAADASPVKRPDVP